MELELYKLYYYVCMSYNSCCSLAFSGQPWSVSVYTGLGLDPQSWFSFRTHRNLQCKIKTKYMGIYGLLYPTFMTQDMLLEGEKVGMTN